MLLYILFPLLCLILFIPVTFCFCFGRYCCCCFTGGCGCCGKRHPTAMPDGCAGGGCKACYGCCGFNKTTKKYSACNKACAYIYMLLFIAAASFFACTAYFDGNAKIPTGVINLATKSPQAMANLVSSTQAPAKVLLTDGIAKTLISFIDNTNSTLNKVVNFGKITKDVKCLQSMVAENFPNATLIRAAIKDIVVKGIDPFPQDSVGVSLVDDLDTKTNAAGTSIDGFQVILTKVNGVKNYDFNTQFTTANNKLSTAKTNVGTIKTAVAEIGTLNTNNIAAAMYTNTNTKSKVDATLVATQAYSTSDGPKRTTMKNDLDSLNTIYTAGKTGASKIKSDITDINNSIGAAKSAITGLLTDINVIKNKLLELPTKQALLDATSNLQTSLNALPLVGFKDYIVGINATISGGKGYAQNSTVYNFDPIIAQFEKARGMLSKAKCLDGVIGSVGNITKLVNTTGLGFDLSALTGGFNSSMITSIVDGILVGSNTLTDQKKTIFDMLKTTGDTFNTTVIGLNKLISAINTANTNFGTISSNADQLDTISSQFPDTSTAQADVNSMTLIDAATIQSITDVETLFTNLQTLVVEAKADIVAHEAAGATATSGKCSLTTTTTCTDYNGCPAGETCEGYPDFFNLNTALEASKTNTAPSITTPTVNDAALTAINLASASSEVSTALGSLPNTNDLATKLTDLKTGLINGSVDLSKRSRPPSTASKPFGTR